jgi:hypothetical protein
MAKTVFETQSKFGKRIRLTESIWLKKILIEHPEFQLKADYVEEVKKDIEDPDYIVKGWASEFLGLRCCEIAPVRPKHLCVVYRELNGEGFIISAFFISRYEKLLRRGFLWQRK